MIEVGFVTLGTGQIRLIFQSAGNFDDSIQQLMMCVRGDARFSATGFINFVGMLS